MHGELNVLMTGDEGFVGAATKRILEIKMDAGQIKGKVIGYDIINGFDFTDPEQLESVIVEEEPNRILHLGAVAHFGEADTDPIRAFETNALGTLNIAELADKYHIPLVYASTGSVYMPISRTPPITEDFPIIGNSNYGCSKALGERYVKSFKTNPHIILRYAHLYGKGKRQHGLVAGAIERIKRGAEPRLYGGAQSNDFTYIDDVVQANYLALKAAPFAWHQAYNIGTGEEITTEDAMNEICRVTGYKGGIKKEEVRTVDANRFVFDISKAQNMLGYKPQYTFHEGLERMFGHPEGS